MTALMFSFVLSAGLLLTYRRFALRFELLDKPNRRSQHSEPTVVGGGVVFALALSAALILFDLPTLSPWLGGGGFIALSIVLSGVGLLDDKFNLPSGLRLAVYTVAATLVFALSVELEWWWQLLGVLALIWVINLVNFMDGLDAFVLCQTLSVAVGMALLAAFALDAATDVALRWLLLAAVLLPFLAFNWPPASMFMGDAGAVFLGFCLGVLGFESALVDLRLGWAWLVLMMPFLVDATGTLLLRLARGHAPHLAHRDHAYQRLARRLEEPLLVDLGLLMLQGIWQFPMAFLALHGGYSTLIAVIFSAIPSVLVLVYMRSSA